MVSLSNILLLLAHYILSNVRLKKDELEIKVKKLSMRIVLSSLQKAVGVDLITVRQENENPGYYLKLSAYSFTLELDLSVFTFSSSFILGLC